MSAAPNQFFTRRHEDEEVFRKKIMIYNFYGFTIVGLMKGGQGKCLQCLSA